MARRSALVVFGIVAGVAVLVLGVLAFLRVFRDPGTSETRGVWDLIQVDAAPFAEGNSAAATGAHFRDYRVSRSARPEDLVHVPASAMAADGASDFTFSDGFRAVKTWAIPNPSDANKQCSIELAVLASGGSYVDGALPGDLRSDEQVMRVHVRCGLPDKNLF